MFRSARARSLASRLWAALVVAKARDGPRQSRWRLATAAVNDDDEPAQQLVVAPASLSSSPRQQLAGRGKPRVRKHTYRVLQLHSVDQLRRLKLRQLKLLVLPHSAVVLQRFMQRRCLLPPPSLRRSFPQRWLPRHLLMDTSVKTWIIRFCHRRDAVSTILVVASHVAEWRGGSRNFDNHVL